MKRLDRLARDLGVTRKGMQTLRELDAAIMPIARRAVVNGVDLRDLSDVLRRYATKIPSEIEKVIESEKRGDAWPPFKPVPSRFFKPKRRGRAG